MPRRHALISTSLLALLGGRGVARADDADDAVRADPPAERAGVVRLTGAQLAARGAVDLATALALLPDVVVRSDGRGGTAVVVRGSRDGSVNVVIDGVLVPDPYDGRFDVAMIPIGDIVEIRVATTPQSPLDGLGGAAGVIEVQTRDAIGPQLVIARITGDSQPGLAAMGTTRVAIARDLALRISASGLAGGRELEPIEGASIGERRRDASGAARLEYRRADLRVVVDGALDDRRYLAPSNAVLPLALLMIDYHTAARVSAEVDARLGKLQLQGRVWSQYLSRRSRFFMDPAMTTQLELESVKAVRSGVWALATRPFWRDFQWTGSLEVDFNKAAVADQRDQPQRSHTTLFEAAAGVRYRRGALRSELALGVAVPFLANTVPWPEGQAVTGYRFGAEVELIATAGYKGQSPTLAELFDPLIGNRQLDPERVASGELRAIGRLADQIHVELAPFYRHTSDAIRTSVLARNFGQLVNRGSVDAWGVDAQARVTAMRGVEAGAGYTFVTATADRRDDAALYLLPHHRVEGWIEARPVPRLAGLVRARYVTRAADTTQRLGSYGLVEASVTATLAPGYQGVLRVDDLLDVRPELRAGERGPGRVVSLTLQGTWE